ncbi:MAG: tRNA (N(6)-L-threonylcarbamoyladenosine(37)-C(2))-methylthiotransferase MtaB, partial [Candidatus Omnitrophica bacterium]|nr:tRNA (N(6)-L-threonylcarbamoyladenosine(37)-C(2))-methylthiotransferase MtaB [Candidatus Omnitrophota bacterium]
NPKMRVKFLTLGCKVNQYETQGLKEKFLEFGFSETKAKADIYVINTCTVTHRADSKSRQLIRQAKKENPKAKIAVCGCLAQLNKAEVEKIGVDYIVPQDQKIFLPEIISGSLDQPEAKAKNQDIWSFKITHFNNQRAFVKIQDGCDNFCSFCKIPYLRGPSRSRKAQEVIEECKIISQKHKEIVLCGVNLALWGRDFEPALSLSDLVAEILAIPGLGRLRLSSLEPRFVDKSLISLFADKKLCPHVHFPFQYGDNRILAAMNKKETVKLYEDKVRQLRKVASDIAISCDIIVGFPGEDDSSFNNTVKFLKTVKPMRMHVFTFSPREKTKFQGVKLTNQKEIKKRYECLQKMAEDFSLEYKQSFLGKTLQMIAEEKDKGSVCGYTENYLRASIKGDFSLGQIISVRIDKLKLDKTLVSLSA